jgi:SAM-dependent methyltransferase
MARIDFLQDQHAKTRRNYLQRVIETDKADDAEVASRFDAEYWDGERRFGYGGYRYDGRWRPLAERLAAHYGLKPGDRVLDVGCGKGFLLYEFTQVVPGIAVTGLDISAYAIEQGKPEVRQFLRHGDAASLPFADAEFDFVVSLGTLHNLPVEKLFSAFREIERVGNGLKKYVMVESFRSMREKVNLLYWQLTCESFHNPESWAWLGQQAGYTGDHGFIFFD